MFKHPLFYVWIVLIGAVVSIGLWRPADGVQGVSQANDKGRQSQDQQPKADVSNVPRVEGDKAGSDHYTADCEKPEKHQDADFCQQVRMADAAEAQNRINRFGLAVLIATLGAALFAAYAAWRTVVTMRDTAERQLRAYVALATVETSKLVDNMSSRKILRHSFWAKWKNVGQTPALGLASNFFATLVDPTDPVVFTISALHRYLCRRLPP